MILHTGVNRPLRGESHSPTSTFCCVPGHFSPLSTAEIVCSANIFHLGLFYVPRSCFWLGSAITSCSDFPIYVLSAFIRLHLMAVCAFSTWQQRPRLCSPWSLSEVSVFHWPFLCMTNRRLNCGLTPLCVLHWLPIPHPCSHLGWWCNETAHVTTQLSWDPQPRANWRMHMHMQPLINPIPKAVCLQTWTALCTQHNEVYLYCTVIHDSLGWCWTLSK